MFLSSQRFAMPIQGPTPGQRAGRGGGRSRSRCPSLCAPACLRNVLGSPTQDGARHARLFVLKRGWWACVSCVSELCFARSAHRHRKGERMFSVAPVAALRPFGEGSCVATHTTSTTSTISTTRLRRLTSNSNLILHVPRFLLSERKCLASHALLRAGARAFSCPSLTALSAWLTRRWDSLQSSFTFVTTGCTSEASQGCVNTIHNNKDTKLLYNLGGGA